MAEEIKDTAEVQTEDTPATTERAEGKKKKSSSKIKEELEQALVERDQANDKYLRLAAEYDNFRKRSAKEREGVYADAYAEALVQILPIIDNLERAAACEGGEGVLDGVKMTLTQFASTLEKLGVAEIPAAVGDPFDPLLHNAVMHAENPDLGENVIAAVFQKGYRKGDKILRYAMVSVAN